MHKLHIYICVLMHCLKCPFLLFAGYMSTVHNVTCNTLLHSENLQVRNAKWQLFGTRVQAHTHSHTEETPPVPHTMPGQAAPDTAVVFSADNLLPSLPALSFCQNVSHVWALLVRELPRAEYRIKVQDLTLTPLTSSFCLLLENTLM